MERRLAAIVSADVVGYSRLMAADEEGTLMRLKAHQSELVGPNVTLNNGRLVKLMGDGALVEFASIVDAVRSSVEIQQAMAARNAEVPPGQQIRYRLGVNVGDIVVEDDDIFGDGVNIAARLQEIAERGGVTLSDGAYRQVRGKLDLAFDDMGEQTLKNIPERVRVWRVRLGEEAATATAPGVPTLADDRPTIAVLPFENMSRDPEHEFLADGISEDIITALSKIQQLLVIARNSTFVYKGQAVNIPQVGRELGARYVLEGSVRSAGKRLRITAQLIDADTGRHVWAERYDRETEDIFDVQDDITRNVTTALQVTLTWGETARLWQDGTRNFEAWQYMTQAWDHWYLGTRRSTAEARRLAERAVEIDPDYGGAWGLVAWTFWFEARFINPDEAEPLLKRAEDIVERLSAAGLAEAQTWQIRSGLHMARREGDAAIAAARRAVELAPSNPEMLAILAEALIYAGQAEEAVARAQASTRLSLRTPAYNLIQLAEAQRWCGALDEALATTREAVNRAPHLLTLRAILVSVLMDMGRDDEAREAARAMLERHPGFSVAHYGQSQFYIDPARLERVLDGLRKAGLPE